MKMNFIQRDGQTLELHMESMLMKSNCVCYLFLYISTYLHILSSSFRKNVNSVFAGMIQTTWLRQAILTHRLSCTNRISFLWYGPLGSVSFWVCQTADVIILTPYCVIFYFEENCICIFTIFAGAKLTPADEEDLRGRWQRAVGPRYEVIVSLSVISVSTELCNPTMYVFKQCLFFGSNLGKTLWLYIANTHLNIFLKVCQLERFGETSGLGISLEARAGHHYLCSILPEGPVGQSGKIFLGDQILEVTDRYSLHRLILSAHPLKNDSGVAWPSSVVSVSSEL